MDNFNFTPYETNDHIFWQQQIYLYENNNNY